MIEVLVSIDHVLDGLVRDQLLGFRDHGFAALLALAALDDHDVILEIFHDGGISAQN